MNTIQPLRKTVTVQQAPAAAFALFTEHIGQWWPLETDSVGLADAVDVRIEPRVGGQVVESMTSGAASVWGTITRWSPPNGIAFTWHPGRPAEASTDIEVTFEPSDDGTTVTLVHGGWDNRPDGAEARIRYDEGWGPVLDRFVSLASDDYSPMAR